MEDMPIDPPQFQSSMDVKLDYLQRDLREIKGDIKDIKTDFVNRREFNEALVSIRKEIADIQVKGEEPTFWKRNQDKVAWGVIGLIISLFYFLLTHNGFPNFLGK